MTEERRRFFGKDIRKGTKGTKINPIKELDFSERRGRNRWVENSKNPKPTNRLTPSFFIPSIIVNTIFNGTTTKKGEFLYFKCDCKS